MVDCITDEGTRSESFLDIFARKAAQQRVPIYGSIELTQRCNLRCVHCYLGPQEFHHKNRKSELTTTQFQVILDQITEAGCLYLLLTGGDPMLRKDFPELYAHAKHCGLLVSVFTNGTLVNDRIIRLFVDLPPRVVEISLYGATAETYEKITGVNGSFQRCIDGIHALLDHSINVNLKTVLMSHNQHEISDIREFARDLGVEFRLDAGISPTLSGDKTPLELRVPAPQAIREEFSDEGRFQYMLDFVDSVKPLPPNDALYQCGAALTSFHIDPFGKLQPCLMTDHHSYDLSNGDFQTGWNNVLLRIREKKAPPSFICNQCPKKHLCGFCPAFFELEGGDEDIRSDYLCSMGHLRFHQLQLGR